MHSCGLQQYSSDSQYKDNSENTIIAVFEDELGYIRITTSPMIDRLNYYFFEPLISYNNFSTRLYIKTSGGLNNSDDILDQYSRKLIKINGRVTNRIISIEEIETIKQISRTVNKEYNYLELTSITEVK